MRIGAPHHCPSIVARKDAARIPTVLGVTPRMHDCAVYIAMANRRSSIVTRSVVRASQTIASTPGHAGVRKALLLVILPPVAHVDFGFVAVFVVDVVVEAHVAVGRRTELQESVDPVMQADDTKPTQSAAERTLRRVGKDAATTTLPRACASPLVTWPGQC